MNSTNTVTAEVTSVTPQFAKHLRATCEFERQRKISDRNVERLRHEIVEGRFVEGTPILLCVLPDRSMRLVNGNHTLEAIAASGKPLTLTLIYRQVESLDEVAKIYATIDVHKIRSWGDALRAFGLLGDFPLAQRVAPAVGTIMDGFVVHHGQTTSSASRGARVEAMEEYRDAADTITICLHGAPKTHQRVLLRAPVLAVALATAKHQPSKAMEFWGGVAADNLLSSKDARKVLLRYLMNNPRGGGWVLRREQAMASAAAWNAFFDGRELDKLQPKLMQQFKLLGTPWAGPVKPSAKSLPAKSQPLIRTGVKLTANGEIPTLEYRG